MPTSSKIFQKTSALRRPDVYHANTTLVRIERTTYSLEGCCSIQLSYRVRITIINALSNPDDPRCPSGVSGPRLPAFGGNVGAELQGQNPEYS